MSVGLEKLVRQLNVAAAGATLLLGMTACAVADPTPAPSATTPKVETPLPRLAPSSTKVATVDAELVSLDGLTSGRVEVVLEDQGRTALVRFIELKTPHSTLGIGGSLEPRGEDPCFDAGPRTEGGSFAASNQDGSIRLPGEVDGEVIREIDVFISGEPSQGGCINMSVARASLDRN